MFLFLFCVVSVVLFLKSFFSYIYIFKLHTVYSLLSYSIHTVTVLQFYSYRYSMHKYAQICMHTGVLYAYLT